MSAAQNDSGTFEFTFRDERYMPFEGLGAVNSQWDISLPGTFRIFDYRTISDVVLRISYTAEEDSTLRGNVENVQNVPNATLKRYLQNPGITRIYSLRHEFPDVWNQLIRKPLNTAVTIDITDRHLPYVVSYLITAQAQALSVSPITILLQTKPGIGNPGLSLDLNGAAITSFTLDKPTGLLGKATNSMQLIQAHTMKVITAGGIAPSAGQTGSIDGSKLEDILLRVDMKLQ